MNGVGRLFADDKLIYCVPIEAGLVAFTHFGDLNNSLRYDLTLCHAETPERIAGRKPRPLPASLRRRTTRLWMKR